MVYDSDPGFARHDAASFRALSSSVQRQLATRARAVIEMKSGIELGRMGGPRVLDEDCFDLHQGMSIPALE
jgi:hypothetical protein